MSVHPSPTARRTFPAQIRRTLADHAEARRRQLAAIPEPAEDDIIAMAHRGSVKRILGEIDAALRRLDTDRYGDCLHCGDQIAMQRLTERPWATHCAWCAGR